MTIFLLFHKAYGIRIGLYSSKSNRFQQVDNNSPVSQPGGFMHELSVTESMLQIALQHAEKAGANRVTDLYVVIGELASIVDDSIQFYWDIISQNTIAEKAHLHFHRIQAQFVCQDCDHRFRPEMYNYGCPLCGSIQVKMTAGDEFYLEAIEVSK